MSALTDAVSEPLASNWEEVIVVSTRSPAQAAHWRPSVNAYRCSDRFVVFVELAGVPPEAIEVSAQPGRVIVRGSRPAPEPACRRAELGQLLALEIDQGAFERVLDLPQEIDPPAVTTEYRDGLLEIRLPLVT